LIQDDALGLQIFYLFQRYPDDILLSHKLLVT